MLGKTSVSLFALLLGGLALFANAAVAQSPPPQPSYFLAVGGGYTEQMGMTGTFGVAISENNFTTVSADFAARVNSVTKKRALYTTIRPGFQRVIARSGPLALALHGDVGAAFGGDAVVGAGSAGGTLVYDVPKRPNLALYASYRAIRSPTQDPTDGAVQSAVSFGVLLKLYKN